MRTRLCIGTNIYHDRNTYYNTNIYHETMKARRKLHDGFLKEVKLIASHKTLHLHLGNEWFSTGIIKGKNTKLDQMDKGLSHTIVPRTHRRLCPFGVRTMAIERKLRVIHPR
jgi:hypothetical protein